MANLKIKKINYILGGRNKLINLDYEILDHTNRSNSTNPIRRNASFLTEEYSESPANFDISAFNSFNGNTLVKGNCAHMLKIDGESNLATDDIIYTMFDIKDLAMQRQTLSGGQITVEQLSLLNSDIFGMIYLPPVDKVGQDTMKFCQYGNTEFIGLSPETLETPYIKRTSMTADRDLRLSSDYSYLDWNFELHNKKTPSFTYIPPSALLRNFTYAERLSIDVYDVPSGSIDRSVSSYFDYISSYDELSVNALSSLFEEKYNFNTVPYSYIYRIKNTLNGIIDSYKYNDFLDGSTIVNYLITKNMYSSLYSTNLSVDGKTARLNNTRHYIDIGTSGGKAYLKYYDEQNYRTQLDDTSVKTPLQELTLTEIPQRTLSYQNVEFIEAVNENGSGHNYAKHPSNLYSIKINKLFANNNNKLSKCDEFIKQKNTIKAEIERKIRLIADKFAPAHTSLFEVQFEDDNAVAGNTRPEMYTVTFKDGLDNSIIQKITHVEAGTNVEAPDIPIHPSTAKYRYEFAGWNPENWNPITSNTEIIANFNSYINEYTVVFKDGYTGEAIKTVTVPYGSDVEAPEPPDHRRKNFTVVFKDGYTDEILKTVTVPYGSDVEAPEPPTHESTEDYRYEFSGWNPENWNPIIKDEIITAFFNEIPIETNEYFKYSDDETKDTIIGLSEWAHEQINLDIPAKAFHLETKYIENNAFENENSIRSIYIPDTILDIGENAFTNCINLHTIRLPESITYTVTFKDGYTDEIIKEKSVLYGTNIEAPDPPNHRK